MEISLARQGVSTTGFRQGKKRFSNSCLSQLREYGSKRSARRCGADDPSIWMDPLIHPYN
jgi:hypothetical protein